MIPIIYAILSRLACLAQGKQALVILAVWMSGRDWVITKTLVEGVYIRQHT